MYALIRDLRHAVRTLCRSPGFALTVIATLTVGIGASAATFTVVRGVLLVPLDYNKPEQLYGIWLRDVNNVQSPLADGDYTDLKRLASAFSSIAARWSNTTSLLGDGEPEEVSVAWVSHSFFTTLGLAPALGRDFDLDEFNAVIVSAGLWNRRFGADSTLIGRTIRLADAQMTVVGILPDGINPNVATIGGRRERNDLFRLMPENRWIGEDRTQGWLRIIARAKDSVTPDQITTDLGHVAEEILTVTPERADTDYELYAVSVLDELVAEAKPYLMVLAVGVGFVFLIACFNVANLSLVRSHLLEKELAIRAAIGAGRASLARQLLVESATITLLGGLGGFVFAHLATRGLLALEPTNLPRIQNIQVDGGVVLFSAFVAVLAVVFVGITPAWRATRVDPGCTLQERAATGTRRQRRFANFLIASEVALSVLLLTGGTLLLRTFERLSEVDPGYEARGLITYSVSNTTAHRGDAGRQFVRDVIRETKAIPGVQYAAFTNRFPFAGGVYTGPYASEPAFEEDAPKAEASIRRVTPEFFDAMGARLLAGRVMTDADGQDVVVIDDVLAAKVWPDDNPVGKRIWTGGLGRNRWSTIVGVVQQMRHNDLTAPGRETVFMPSNYEVGDVMRAAVRVRGDAEVTMPTIRRVVRSLDPDATIGRVSAAEDLLRSALAPTRFVMLIIAAFAGVALLLAGVGVFSMVSFSAGQRTREFGLRIALGETSGGIFRHVVREGVVLATSGIVVGVVGIVLLARFLESMLFGVQPLDPVSLTVGIGSMGVTGIFGGWLPARRAARLDPAATLKAE